MEVKKDGLTLEELRERIWHIRESPNEKKSYHTWERVAEEFWPGLNRAIPWKIAYTNYVPTDPILRMKLGLRQISTVIPIEETIPNGTIALKASVCHRCDQYFISNHPRRRKCFICSPFRGRKP
jgi:hypothetical protein